MQNIKTKSLILTTLICIFCTKLHAQIQWNLNAYHDYSTYIDLNCSLNGESNGTEAFLFYADNRSESKISFTVNYTITDNCGKSHSGSWSTNIIQAGQRGSSFVSVFTGCPIQKGKGHLVKNITCTVSNFKDLSKNESNSTSANTYTPTTTATSPATTPLPKSVYSGSIPNNSSNNTQAKTTTTAGSTSLQRQAALEAEELSKYNEQRQRIADQRKADEAASQQFAQNATELVGLVGNALADARAEREKKEARKEAERAQQRKKAQEMEDFRNSQMLIHLEKANNGDFDAMVLLGEDYIRLSEAENAETWFRKVAARGDVRGMLGMAQVVQLPISKALKKESGGESKKEMVDQLAMAVSWYEKAAYAGSITAVKELISIYLGSPVFPYKTMKKDEKIIAILNKSAEMGYAVPLRFLYNLYRDEGVNLYNKALKKIESKDYSPGVKLYTEAIEKFSPEAMTNLGRMYFTGEFGTPVNKREGLELWLKAAILKNETACENLGYAYREGDGITVNQDESKFWYKVAELVRLFGGDPIEKSEEIYKKAFALDLLEDYDGAFPLYLKAANMGNIKAMSNLSHYYYMGYGVPENQRLSEVWKKRSEVESAFTLK